MTILTIPFVGISLLEHSAGGAILAKGGAYLAGTYVTPAVAQAFTTASSVLSSMGAATGTVASGPVLAAGLTVAVVAGGAYCYFYGLPVPIEAALAKAGLGTSAKKGLIIAAASKGFAVPVASLAVALVLLGGAGYVSYHFYQSEQEAKAAAADFVVIEGDGQSASEAFFGSSVWSRYGEALWSGLGDAAERAAKLAADAVEFVSDASSAAAGVASDAAGTAYDAAAKLRREGSGILDRIVTFLRRRPHAKQGANFD